MRNNGLWALQCNRHVLVVDGIYVNRLEVGNLPGVPQRHHRVPQGLGLSVGHQARLQQVFQKIQEAGLKLQPKKCTLALAKVAFLGHLVSQDGIKPDPKLLSAIRVILPPTTVKDTRRAG